jgi:alpha-N-acetylglucosaminidase
LILNRNPQFVAGTLTVLIVLAGAPVSTGAEVAAVLPARGLIHRLLPEHEQWFILEQIPSDEGRDVFEIESQNNQIVLRGNNGVSLAAGLNWYLKYYCECSYALKTRQLHLPDPLPPVWPKVRRVSSDRWRYFLNYCCFGYSLCWYDWRDWEKLIDWMALNGVNAPLSVTGQEAVWIAAGRQLGFTDSELRDFLAGPPYLPFGWMGCLDGWGGPLPKDWVARHTELQKRILARERSLGMTPVLQGFTGHVPPATRARFPDTHLHSVKWAEWETLLLDPLDPLFGRFASTFLKDQKRLFGTDHLYAADTFIEMTPPSGDTNFLAATAKAIYRGMADSDPLAIWVLQGWTFYNQAEFWTEARRQAFLDAVPNERMLVLDLFCDVNPVWKKTRAFDGKPWVWCALQNFGDCVYLGGALNRISADLPAARKDPLRAQLSGIGFVNEGLDYNPVVFDYLFEQAWRSESIDVNQWLKDYCRRAYGVADPEAEAAWGLLKDTVFTGQHQVVPAYMRVPSLAAAAGPPYSNESLVQAWHRLLKAAPAVCNSDSYLFDLLSVGRQALGNFSAELQANAVEAWREKDRAAFREAAGQMLGLIRDLDRLLATRPEYLLGSWLEGARRWAKRPAEKAKLEWNARRVITMWGERPLIRDYSRREWSGMLTGFYLKRWERFFNALDSTLDAPVTFDERDFDDKLQHWELAWANQRESYPTKAIGDPLAISQQLWEKYQLPLAKAFAPEVPSLTTGRPATCSSAIPGHEATLANDGRARSTDAYWATDVTNDLNPWWEVDFQKPTILGRVVLVGYFGDRRYYGFILEGSLDGQRWETLADKQDNQELSTRRGYTSTFPPREMRYLRVRQTGNSANTGRHLVEVMAFEK